MILNRFFITTFLLLFLFNSNVSDNNYGWGKWKKTSCLKGLDYRIKKGVYNKESKAYRWKIQFRNRYAKPLHINYSAVPKSKSTSKKYIATDRIHIKSNHAIYSTYYDLKEKRSISIIIDKVRVGVKDSGKFYKCSK
ncbi:hypothetical protein OD91_0289 [Lutibacter sp. Hel_I_33_5]|uniref:hypothetical protein n=1 Tax=Lutibacter sp. Hel_I_33_5 TaxID=1566289 RepID=UPI0011A1AA6E|nr:hypothetical protein [Lutibacter sp. Hel_I_33_5]TVZ55048.1 hypothetical protein OD91_0289 [Lutibacter sp. Hel_I_33_5]